MKTRTIKLKEVEKKWYLIDANGIRLGTLATKAASLLLGKGKVKRTDNLDSGDVVIVINSSKVSIHPRKKQGKKYYRHSGYMGSLKVETFETLQKRAPNQIIVKAVKGMMPLNKQRAKMLKNLFVYSGAEHTHEAQQPIKVNFE